MSRGLAHGRREHLRVLGPVRMPRALKEEQNGCRGGWGNWLLDGIGWLQDANYWLAAGSGVYSKNTVLNHKN